MQAQETLWVFLQCEKVEEEEGIQYPCLEGCLLMICGPKWVAPPHNWFRSTEKLQGKLAGKATKIPKSWENFC